MPRSVRLPCCILVASVMSTTLPAQVPGFPSPDWTYQSNLASAALGTWVSAAGDVNGDGFDDVAVSATGYDGANLDEGLVLLFLGGAAGLSSSPDWSVSGINAGDQLSAREKTGDINGDGYDDLLLSDGRLFFGSSTGISFAFQATTVTNYFGRFVALDVDGDGYGDVSLGYDLWRGSPSGLSPSGVSFRKNIKGSAGSLLSDLTGDGFVDLVIASDQSWEDRKVETDGGMLHLFLGGPNGPARKRSLISGFTWSFASPSMRAAGDLDADGYNDFLLALYGDPDVTPVPGWFSSVYYFRGSSSGFVEPGGPFSGTGASRLNHLDGAGDVNGDGYDDLLFVDEGYLGFRKQRAWLVSGGPGGPTATIAELQGLDLANGWATRLASGAGDVNGDGYDDLIVGWPEFGDGEAGEGRVTLFLGSGSWPAATAR